MRVSASCVLKILSRPIQSPDGLRSIIRQRNSFSRLNITQQLFEFLLSKCGVFAQFKEFVLCFGTKTGENEIGPPQLRYRIIPKSTSDKSASGFGWCLNIFSNSC